MDHSNPITNWFHSQFDSNQPIHQPPNPHLDDHSLTTPINHYRPHPPVNHQQFQGAHHPPADPAAFASTSYSHYPTGPFPLNEYIPEWTQWDQHLQGAGHELGGMYAAPVGQGAFQPSAAIELDNDPLASWRPKLTGPQPSSSIQTRVNEPHSGPSQSAFSAFLHTAPAHPSSAQPSHPQPQPISTPHSPAVSPLHQPVPLPHNSPPAFVNQFSRSQSYSGSPTSRPRPNPQPSQAQSLTGAFTQIGSPSRPGIQYHTEPSRRNQHPLSARSVPADWRATYVLGDHRVRAQSTSHIPVLTATPSAWNTAPGPSNAQPDTFHSYLGLSLGDDRPHVGEMAGSSSSEGGHSDWGSALVGGDHWQHQTVPPSDLNSSGIVAGRFDSDCNRPTPPDLAGPSSSRYDSPALGPRLESLDLQTCSPQSQASSQLSASQAPISTAFSAYDPKAPSSDGRKGRVPRRKPNEPPRNPNMRRYPCPLCVVTPRTFARPSALKIHMLTHTKEKPHTCSVCLRAFAIPSNLKRHLKLHAKEGRGSQDSTATTAIEEAEEAGDEILPDEEPDSTGHE